MNLAGVLGIAGLLSLYLVFVALTYPELGVPAAGLALVFAGYRSILTGGLSRNLASLLLALFVVALCNLSILSNASEVFRDQLQSGSGWNIFGDPKSDLLRYFLNAQGLGYPLQKRDSSIGWICIALGFAISWLLAGWAIFVYGRNSPMRPLLLPVALWVLGAAYVSFAPLVAGGNWYPAAKFFSQFAIGIVLVFGVALRALASSNRDATLNRLSVIVGLSIVAVSLGATELGVLEAKRNVEVLEFKAWKSALQETDKTLPLIILAEREGEVLWFAEIVAKGLGYTVFPISARQSD